MIFLNKCYNYHNKVQCETRKWYVFSARKNSELSSHWTFLSMPPVFFLCHFFDNAIFCIEFGNPWTWYRAYMGKRWTGLHSISAFFNHVATEGNTLALFAIQNNLSCLSPHCSTSESLQCVFSLIEDVVSLEIILYYRQARDMYTAASS